MIFSDKEKRLHAIKREVENCSICKKDKIGIAVFGEGSPDAKVMFIGEAPGRNESLTGRPFVGRSGILLRNTIKLIGLDEKEVYITSPVKYLPVYKTPTDIDITHGMVHLSKQLKVINPKLIVLLGSVAARGVLGEKLKISDFHGKIIKRDGKPYFVSYHPSAGLRFPRLKVAFLKDFESLKKYLS